MTTIGGPNELKILPSLSLSLDQLSGCGDLSGVVIIEEEGGVACEGQTRGGVSGQEDADAGTGAHGQTHHSHTITAHTITAHTCTHHTITPSLHTHAHITPSLRVHMYVCNIMYLHRYSYVSVDH